MTTQSVREKSLPSRLVAAVTQRSRTATSATVKKAVQQSSSAVKTTAAAHNIVVDEESSSPLNKSLLSEVALDTEAVKSVAEESSSSQLTPPPTPKTGTVPRRNPGQPDAAKKFIDKKPTARVIGAALLEQLYKNNQVNILMSSPNGGLPKKEVEDDPGPAEPAMSSSDPQESVGQENRCTTTKRSSLRTAQNTHRVSRVNKHLTFWGTEGAECTHVYFYEAVHVKLPWPGLKTDRAAKLASNEAWIKRKHNQAKASAMANRARLF